MRGNTAIHRKDDLCAKRRLAVDSRMVCVGDIATFVRNGKSIKQAAGAAGFPITRIETISHEVVDPDRVGFANLSEADIDEKWYLEKDDILFSHINSLEHIGKTAIFSGIPERLVHGMNLLCIRPDSKYVEARYLLHALREPRARIRLRMLANKAVNQASISATALKAFQISLPSLKEQRRIAAILDKVDALRAKRREAIAKLDQLLQSVFLEMFGDPVTNPKHWAEGLVLGEAADVASGITKGRKIENKSTRAVAYLAVANVQDRVFDLNTVKEIEATEQEIEKYRLLPGDLLLTEGGDPDKLGRGALWQGQLDPCIHQNHIFRVRAESKDIDPVYLSWLVSSSRGKRYFLRSAKQTTGIASINMTQLRSFPLLVPPLELQKRFRRFVMEHYKKMEILKKSDGRIDELFKSIQQKAFQTAV